MDKTLTVKENERKFLIVSIKNKAQWEKEQIVYQWFIKSSTLESSKLKLIIDCKNGTKKFVHVVKNYIQDYSCSKKVTYLTEKDIKFDTLLGYGFVMKRRSIQGEIFLDHFLRSNGTCEYLLELEDDQTIDNASKLGVVSGEDVSKNPEYQNCNMTIPFELSDLKELGILLSSENYKMEL